jgi:hypothetical protein
MVGESNGQKGLPAASLCKSRGLETKSVNISVCSLFLSFLCCEKDEDDDENEAVHRVIHVVERWLLLQDEADGGHDGRQHDEQRHERAAQDDEICLSTTLECIGQSLQLVRLWVGYWRCLAFLLFSPPPPYYFELLCTYLRLGTCNRGT